jgi:hypothetical protein
MKLMTRGHNPIAQALKVLQVLLYVFITIYAFAGWTFAGDLISLKSVMLLILIGAALQHAAGMIPTSRTRRSPNRFILASL